MFDVTSETTLPRLSSDLKLVKGGHDEDGTPIWRLYHPVSHQYFQIGWIEFEYLSRFSLYSNYGDLKDAISSQTTLEPDDDVFRELLIFLNDNGLLHDDHGMSLKPPEKKQKPILSQLVHKYLFFSVPLVRPQSFLIATYPYVSFLFRRETSFITILVLMLAILITLGRIDEFFHTFLDMFSPQGALTIALTFTIIKIFHELGHAYSAYKHGLIVPHMGIAFMVMYPVFYTETTSAWHLASRREKIEIGLGGIRIELMLAAIFLLIWNYTSPGIIQSIAFSLVTISLIGSLLINLNPLMRFDGYFILSDMIGVENLHSRSFKCARWRLRKFLFGWKDEAPEQTRKSKLNFFIGFGWATLIYRFFLFLGIAVLVYVLFPKPLGLILMIIELLWFIVRPMWSEVSVWLSRSPELIKYWQGKVTFSALLLAIIMICLPVQNHITAPALYHAAEYRDIYAPSPAKIMIMNIAENRKVEEGETLISLISPELEKDYKLSVLTLEELKKLRRRQQTDVTLMRENSAQIKSDIEQLNFKIRSLENKKAQLDVKAPFAGYIKDTDIHLHEGRYIDQETLLFRIINTEENLITAYVTDHDLERIDKDNKGHFFPDYAAFTSLPVQVDMIDQTNISNLDKEELSSVYGGPIYSEVFQEAEQQVIVPRQSLYKVTLNTENQNNVMATPGYVKISGAEEAPIILFLNWLYSFILPESDVI